MGFEPMIRVLQTLALATWPRRLAFSIVSKSSAMVKKSVSCKLTICFCGEEGVCCLIREEGSNLRATVGSKLQAEIHKYL